MLKKKVPIKNSVFSNIATWITIILTAYLLWTILGNLNPRRVEIDYSTFINELDKNNIKSVTITEKEIVGNFQTPITISGIRKPFQNFKTRIPFEDPELINNLIKKKVTVN
ncbi:MAG: ATP-dependent metallopeptidase FtsH/Yme1/Tma family protein, partial [candidate division WOR-3 bacterium]|nr:ATP-dependent metallopeptidase FtsH/Yme1/Tma family protein [candidate division WOR-3 bacterium]